MANRIQIRRGSGKPTTSQLMQYELGWDTTNNILYINTGTGSGIVPTFTGVNDLSMGTTSQVNGRKLRFYSKDNDTTDTRHIWLGYANDHNRFYIYDATNGVAIITSDANGTSTFYGNATNVSGTVAIANGGTGATTASAALTNLGALPLTGGTLTGNLTISKSSNPVLILKNTVMDTSAQSLTDNAYNSIYFRDKDDREIVYLQGMEQKTDGRVRLTLAVQRRDSNNSETLTQSLQMFMAADGTAAVSISHPGAWRQALGVVSKSGDIMTGNLGISHGASPTLTIQNTDIDTKASSLSAPEYSNIYFRDKNTDAVRLNGSIQASQDASGIVGFTIAARRMNSGNTNELTNYLKLTMAADGTATVNVNNPAAWRTGLNVVNKSGDTMTGSLTTSGNLTGAVVQSNNTIANVPSLRMSFSDKDNQLYGLIQTYRTENYGGRVAISQYSENSNGNRTAYREIYYLPAPAQGLTANVNYSIITTPGATDRRRLFVTDTAAVPSGAINGDIVLVKVT